MSRVLVADDEAHIREVVSYALARDGHQVEAVADGEQALARVARGGVELVVLDVLMPELDGLAVCRRVRATARVPIIFLSSRTEEADRVLGLELGGDDDASTSGRAKTRIRPLVAPPIMTVAASAAS